MNMTLIDAQRTIEALSHGEYQHPDARAWVNKSVALVAALLPVLAWPGESALRGSRDELFDIDHLIACSNAREGDLTDCAWQGVRDYLASRVPCLTEKRAKPRRSGRGRIARGPCAGSLCGFRLSVGFLLRAPGRF
jgi:hypothetical protein